MPPQANLAPAFSKIEQVELALRAELNGFDERSSAGNAQNLERIAILESELARERESRIDLEKKFDELVASLNPRFDKLTDGVAQGSSRTADLFNEHNKQIIVRDNEASQIRNELQQAFDQARSDANSGISFVADDAEKKIRNTQLQVDEICRDIKQDLADAQVAITRRCEQTEENSSQRLDEVDRQMHFLESFWAKSIEWKLALNDTWQQDPVRAGRQTFWSPRFDLAGVRGLQIEAHLDPGEANQPYRVICNLWAGGDASLCWRLSAGGLPSVRLSHVFRKHGPVGTTWDVDRSKCQTHLVIGLELCEATVPQKSVSSITPGLSTMVPSIVKVKKHVMHQANELVQASAAKLNSRFVRKVEWRIEDILNKISSFSKGEVVKSPTFCACGVDGIQIWFYPSGYTKSSNGFVGVFLYAPAGVEVNCDITIGSTLRPIKHKFDNNQSEPFGRANFAQHSKIVDEGQTELIIQIDFHEVKQNVEDGKCSSLRFTRQANGCQMLDEVLELCTSNLKSVANLEPVLKAPRKVIAAGPLRSVIPEQHRGVLPPAMLSHKQAIQDMRQAKSLTSLEEQKPIKM